jgi:outer membrane lipoprotein
MAVDIDFAVMWDMLKLNRQLLRRCPMTRPALLLFLTLIMLPGCAHLISEESRRLVDSQLTFGKLREDPDAYSGKYVMLGGIIGGVRNARTGGELEIVQFDLDRSDMPENIYNSGGRFLVTTPSFLDAMVYKRGRLVTVVGEVKGRLTRPLDSVDYTYPVISLREIHISQTYEAEQGFAYPPPAPYYDPYYFGYWPDMYRYRPLGPRLDGK